MDLLATREHMQGVMRSVGAMQRQNFRRSDLKISSKTVVADLVTEIDVRSEKMLIAGVLERHPDHGIISEESDPIPSASGYTWVMDPLDGTVNYAHGLPHFCISVALQHHGQTVLGMIYAPMSDEFYSATFDGPALCNGKSLKVSAVHTLERAIVSTGFPYDRKTNPINNLNYFSKIMPDVTGVRRFGAAALDLCFVASGFIDAYWELSLKPWDVAAGALIVERAGGKVISLREDRDVSILAGNDALTQVMLGIFREVDRATV